jgi:hypothetical protein
MGSSILVPVTTTSFIITGSCSFVSEADSSAASEKPDKMKRPRTKKTRKCNAFIFTSYIEKMVRRWVQALKIKTPDRFRLDPGISLFYPQDL